MLTINTNNRSVCSGLSRRDLLRVGGAGLFGTSVNQLLASEAVRAATGGRAKSVMFLFLFGGRLLSSLLGSFLSSQPLLGRLLLGVLLLGRFLGSRLLRSRLLSSSRLLSFLFGCFPRSQLLLCCLLLRHYLCCCI